MVAVTGSAECVCDGLQFPSLPTAQKFILQRVSGSDRFGIPAL
jgi:hypothetical protein